MKKANKKKVEEFIRVDHAGERGAIKIYEGQLLALNTIVKDENLKKIIEEMKVHEEEHCNFFENEIKKRNIKPTKLLPFWDLLGIGLGIVLAHQVIDIVTQNINDHFFQLVVEELIISYLGLFKAAILGIGITVVASIVPAYEATVVSPGSAISRLSLEIGFSRVLPKLTLLGLAISGVGGCVLLFPSKNIILGFVGLFGLITGLAVIVLVSTKAVFSVTRRMSSLRFSITGFFAIKLLAGSVSRVSLAVAALSMAVSLTVGIGVMVQSFRLTVDHWLETSLGRGIYVSPVSMSLTRFDSSISPEVLVRLKNIDGVTKITAVRHVIVDTTLGPSHLVAANTDFESFNQPAKFKKGNPQELWEEFNNSDIVLISEPFAYH